MGKITLYSTGCPRCTQLKAALEKAGVKYVLCNSVEVMLALGFDSVPVLGVERNENGIIATDYLRYEEAIKWIREEYSHEEQ